MRNTYQIGNGVDVSLENVDGRHVLTFTGIPDEIAMALATDIITDDILLSVPPFSADTNSEPDLLQMQHAVSAAWTASMTPPELRAACLAFHTEERRHVDHLRAMLLVTIGFWIGEGAKQGHDRHMLEQVAASEAHRAIAMLMRSVKARRGEQFVPARMAIVAYFMADAVANAEPFICNIDGAIAAFDADITEGRERTHKLLTGASHALRSYQHGNASPDLAAEIADAIDAALRENAEHCPPQTTPTQDASP